MNEEIHPLDRDDDELESSARREDATLERRLLKYCVWTAIAGGATICVVSAATANAAYQSPVQRIGEALEWVAGIIALSACVGMLVVFRLKSIRAWIEQANQKASQAPISRREMASEIAQPPAQYAGQHTPYSEGHGAMQPSRSNYSADLGLPIVLIASLIYLVVCWILAFALRPFPDLAFILPILQMLVFGVSITMVVFNTGVTRAFAIGFLATSVFSVFGIFSSFVMFFERSRYSGGPTSFLEMALPMAVSTSVVCGWLCATYVWVLQRIFSLPARDRVANPAVAEINDG